MTRDTIKLALEYPVKHTIKHGRECGQNAEVVRREITSGNKKSQEIRKKGGNRIAGRVREIFSTLICWWENLMYTC